ncbi:MAG: penicillin-binding protein 1B [Pseudomonadota bacterium]
MATRKSKRRRTSATSDSRWRLAAKFVLYSGLLVTLGVLGYLVYLDRTVTSTFDGRRWSIPAQVYAQPLELHAGAAIDRFDLQAELQRLGYQADANLRNPGTYKVRGDALQIYLRAFQFMERHRPSQRIDVRFAGAAIEAIYNETGEVPLIRLDPATIGSFFPAHGEDRLILTPDQVPPLLSEGLKAVEDRNFDRHVGFSIRGILRALWVNLRSGERQQGGSTLTQQLVKSYFLDNRRTIQRKLQEVAMAVILEARFAKEDLLTAYINEIFLGQNGTRAIHGFGLGALFYFNKPLSELNVSEVATMISIIRGPSYYNPFRYPERAQERRDLILNIFHRDGLIAAEQLEVALQQPLGVIASPISGGAYYPAFMDRVRYELQQYYDREALSSAGLRIFTTIQPRKQEAVQAAVSITLNDLESSRNLPSGSLQGAALVADSQTGEILALVGGRKGRVDGFNRALSARRPVGSLIKPVIYLSALEAGMHLASPIEDSAVTIQAKLGQSQSGEAWTPKNFDGAEHGSLPLVRALAESLNLATVNLGMKIGLEQIQQRFANLVGREPANRYPSFLLGAESLSPVEMLEFYGNFASGGFRTVPKAVIAVLDEQGKPVSHHPFALQQTIQADDVGAINRALEITMAKGTGRSSPYARHGVAGKTGTSNDNRDSWFAGFDNRQVAVVWVGRDDNAVTGLTGSTGALRVWNMMAARDPLDPLQHMPSQQLVEIEYLTGLRARANCADVVRLPMTNEQLQRLPVKPGCGIRNGFGGRLRQWLGE